MPRPHKLLTSPDLPEGGKEITKRICDLILSGNYPEIAAQNCGVSGTRFYEWRRKGEEHKSQGIKSDFSDFCDAVNEAVAQSEAKVVQIIHQALPQDPRLALEYASRRWPWRYGRPRDRAAVQSDSGSAAAKPLAEILSEIAMNARGKVENQKSATSGPGPSQTGDG